MSVETVTVTESPTTVTIDETTLNVTVTQSDNSVVVVDSGIQGAKGDKGDTGATGPAGVSGGQYTHTQYTPSATWTIVHNLTFNPNVTVVDSAGTVVEGSFAYPDTSTVIITFSASFAGYAYLS